MMRKIRLAILFGLLIFSSVDETFAQRNLIYPQTAEGVIDFVETLLNTNFSEKQIVKRLGTIKKSDDENDDYDEYYFSVEPHPAGRKIIEDITIFVNDENKRVEQVDFIFAQPAKISYGALRKKYGLPRLLPSPIVNCGKIKDCNRNLFVGYAFEDNRSIGAEKSKLRIHLQMKAVSTVPKHSDKSMLEVASLSFRLVSDL